MRTALLSILLLFTVSISAEEFLSKDYIDTTVNRAFYAFVAANRGAGGEYTQESAIEKAKQTVETLKRKAETDPNRRYILWKLSDLESQIALEEEELFIKAQFQRVQEINKLVSVFNKELKNEYPSFGKLHAIHKTMLSVDIRHANELADLINGHNRFVTQDLKSKMSSFFQRKDYSSAEEMYSYAIKNRKYLNLSEYDYNLWGSRIEQKKTADYLKANLDKRVKELRKLAEDKNIAKARRVLEILSLEVDGAAQHLGYSFTSQSQQKIRTTEESLTSVEDSLVAYNISLIRGSNTKDAIQYMNNVLRPAGVLPEKVAKVDRAILASGGKTVDAKTKAGVSSEMTSFAFEQKNRDGAMTDIKKKIVAKKDSLRRYHNNLELATDHHFEKKHKRDLKAYEEEAEEAEKMRGKADKILLKCRKLMDKGKYVKAEKLLYKKQSFIAQWSTAKKYYYVKVNLNKYFGADNDRDSEVVRLKRIKYEQSPEGCKERAEKLVGDIYVALDAKGSDAAYDIYYKNRSFLQEYAFEAAYNTVRLYVIKEYNKEFRVYDK